MRTDRAHLVLVAAATLGVSCGGAPAQTATPETESTSTAQMIDGEARCGVGSSEEEEDAQHASASTAP